MAKNLLKGMAALVICAAFASCSKDADFESAHQSAVFENLKNQYKAAFVQRYGEIDPNQSWDFTDLTKSPMTRGELSVTPLSLYNGFQTSVSNDKTIIEGGDYTTGLSTFNPYFSADLYAAFSHAKSGEKYNYYHFGVYKNGQVTEIPAQINVKDGKWYDRGNGGSLNQNSGRRVNTKSMTNDNIKFVAYPTRPTRNNTQADRDWNAYVASHMDEFIVENYKVVTVHGRTYWCFDCNNDNDYSDLIFQVVSYEAAPPTWKRYMIEDLGGNDDFDFNDIVVDVIQDYATSSQKAIVRAMGGTIDFALTIGDMTTPWTKVGAGFIETKMYNTEPTPKWDENLAEFTVTGWNPSENNISVTVKHQDSNGVLTEVNIPFPKDGDAPMIIAVYPLLVDWMLERVSIPTNFFYEIQPSAAEVE